MRDKRQNSVSELENIIAEMEAITEFEKKQRNLSSVSGSSQENGDARLGPDSFNSGNQIGNGDIWVKRLAKDDDQIWLKQNQVVSNAGTNKVRFKEPKFRSTSLSLPSEQPPKKLYLKNQQTLDFSPKHNSVLQAENNIHGLRTNPCGTPHHLSEFYGTNSCLSETSRRSCSDAAESSRTRSISSSTDNSTSQIHLSPAERSPFLNLEFSQFSPISNGKCNKAVLLNESKF